MSKRSIEDIEIMRRYITRFIEAAINFQDALINYQKEFYEPALKDPFCSACGESVSRNSFKGFPWMCRNCQKSKDNNREKEKRLNNKMVLEDGGMRTKRNQPRN